MGRVLTVKGDKKMEYWEFCSEKCALTYWNDEHIDDGVWLNKRDYATVHGESSRPVTCDACKVMIFHTCGAHPYDDTEPTDIVWWWER